MQNTVSPNAGSIDNPLLDFSGLPRFDAVRNDPRLADLTAREMRLPAPQFALLRAVERRGM